MRLNCMFLSSVMALATAGAAFAEDTLTVTSWGGAYTKSQEEAFFKPFAKQTGTKILQDEWDGSTAKLKGMVETGQVTWDIVDVEPSHALQGCDEGWLETIDYSKLGGKDAFIDGAAMDCAVATIVFGTIYAYDAAKFPNGGPTTMADLFDTAKFPGPRALRKSPKTTLEFALIADGVKPSEVYDVLGTPAGVDRAFKKLDTIKKNTIFWETNSQSQQLFTDGEVTCGLILNGRAYDAIKKGAKIALEWNQNIQSVDYLVVPKGSKRLEIAMALIDSMTVAENQAKVANLIAYSPTNPQAFASIDKEVAPWLSTNPDNAKQGFIINAEYWRDNLQKLQERWESWKLS